MGLLRADCQGLLNGVRARDGRGALVARLLPPLMLGLMYWLLGAVLLQYPELLAMLRGGGDSLRQLFATALSPCPVVAGWIGLAHAQRQLFEAPELGLWLQAPLRAGRAAWQVFARAAGLALLWAAALAAPLLVQLLATKDAPWAAWAAVPLALLAAVLPSLGVVLAAQVALLRLARGRWARLLLGWVGALTAFGFPVFLLAQMFAGSPAQVEAIAGAAERGERPARLVAQATELLVAAVRGQDAGSALGPCLLAIAAGLALFALAAPLHPVAVQHHQLAYRPRRVRGRRWPAGAVAAVRRKEFAQLLQQPGALLHMLLVGATVYVLAGQRILVHDILERSGLPLQVRHCGALLFLWFLAVLMLLYAHMGRLAVWDGAQWPLWQRAPVRPAALLAGKLQAIAVLLCWPLAVAALAGAHWFGADGPTVLAFLGFGLAGNLAALATVAAIGTWPGLLRRELDGRLSQGSRGFAASIVLVLAFYLAVSPGFAAWVVLYEHEARRPPGAPGLDFAAAAPVALAAALGLGLLLLLAPR
jgi:hypothetical protein